MVEKSKEAHILKIWDLTPEDLEDPLLKKLVLKPENYKGGEYFKHKFSRDPDQNLLIPCQGQLLPWNDVRNVAPFLMVTKQGFSFFGSAFNQADTPKGQFTVQVVNRLDFSPYAHSFLRLVDPNGNIESYGFYPIRSNLEEPSPIWDMFSSIIASPSEIASADPVEYDLHKNHSITIHSKEINFEAYQKLRHFILNTPQFNYNILNVGNALNCSGWVRTALKVIDIEVPSYSYYSSCQEMVGIDTPWKLDNDLKHLFVSS